MSFASPRRQRDEGESAAQLGFPEDMLNRHVTTNPVGNSGANDRTHAVTIGPKRGIIEL